MITKDVYIFDWKATQRVQITSFIEDVLAGEAKVSVVQDKYHFCDNLPDEPFILVTNSVDFHLLANVKKKNAGTQTVLVTKTPMLEYNQQLGGEEHKYVDYVISNHLPNEYTLMEIRATLKKLVSDDIFGLRKYLLLNNESHSGQITGSDDRILFNETILRFCEEQRLGGYYSRLACGITEELLMNAVYDAPAELDDRLKTKSERNKGVKLSPKWYSTFSYGFDGMTLGVSVSDPFGTLKKDKFVKYTRKILKRHSDADFIDSKVLGAGLGLFKIMYSSHSLIVNSDPGKQTEVIALINTKIHLRDFAKMPRSIFFFTKEISNSE